MAKAKGIAIITMKTLGAAHYLIPQLVSRAVSFLPGSTLDVFSTVLLRAIV